MIFPIGIILSNNALSVKGFFKILLIFGVFPCIIITNKHLNFCATIFSKNG